MSSTPLPPPTQLPRITVQPDYPAVLRDIHQGLHAVEDFWVSCYAETSLHGRVRVTEEDNHRVSLLARDGVEVAQISDSELLISCDNLAIPATPVHFPVSTPFTLKGGIDALAISPNGSSFVVGGKDSKARVGSVSGDKIVELRGHVGDLSAVVWFPSNEVVLTGSSDFSIRVFSAIDGSNPRTLIGHTKAITNLTILGVGKNVLSSSLDGTTRLWSIGSAEETSLIRLDHPITSMIISSPSAPLSTTALENSTDEGDLRGRLAIVGFNNGELVMIDLSLGVKEGVRSFSTGGVSSITCVDYDLESGTIVCGTRKGIVYLFDSNSKGQETEGPVKPIISFTRSGASILSIAFSNSTTSTTLLSSPSILIGTADGLPYRAIVNRSPDEKNERPSVRVLEEFAGLDCDSSVVTEVSGTGQVWIGGGDGVLRRYRRGV